MGADGEARDGYAAPGDVAAWSEAVGELKPLVVELYCGMFGWSAGWLALGGSAIGVDIEHLAHHGPVPAGAELILQDVRTIHGSMFRHASLILASPPCQTYSYMAMPWKRGKALAAWYRESPERIRLLNELWDACFRIQIEASRAACRYIPLVIENVQGAQPWVGRAKAHYGSFYLWGDIWQHGNRIYAGVDPLQCGGRYLISPTRGNAKVPGLNWSGSNKPGYVAQAFNDTTVRQIKNAGGSWFGIGSPGQKETGRNPVNGRKGPGGDWFADGRQGQHACAEGIKQHGSGADWWREPLQERRRGNSRKAASAMIAKIPEPLSRFVAEAYFPR